MRKILTLLALVVLLAGCYNQRKAVDQMNKGIARYEDQARTIFRGKFPCITTGFDSTKFISSIRDLEFALYRRADSLRKTALRLQVVRDSIRQAMTGDDCPELLNQAADAIARLQVQNEGLQDDTAGMGRDIRRFRAQIPLIRPVIQQVKDSSEIKDALVRQAAAEKESEKWESLYDTDHAWRVKKEAKEVWNYMLPIPKPLIWLLIVIGIISIYARIKIGVFNPLKLFTKKQ